MNHVPSVVELEAMNALLRPWQLITAPVFHGTELVPDTGPALFVGNHTIFGLLDLPLLIKHVQSERGLFLRGLAVRRAPGFRPSQSSSCTVYVTD